MELKLSVDVAMVAAVILGELLSILWYSDSTPWGRRGGSRYFLAAIVANIGLVFILKHITYHYWTVNRWEDAAMLGGCLTLVYAALEAPHAIWDARSFSRFFYHCLHKALLVFVMSFALFHFKNYKNYSF